MTTIEPQVLAINRNEDCVELRLHVPTTLAWFDGHFPDVSLLPGVIQTMWAIQFGRRHFAAEFQAAPRFQAMSNVKFMRFIVPGANIELRLRYSPARYELSFEYREGAAVCASGRIRFAP